MSARVDLENETVGILLYEKGLLTDKLVLLDKDMAVLFKEKRISLTPSGYAALSWNGKHTMVHRIVMNAQTNQIVDHINRNRLDNQRKNLRFVDHSTNMHNRVKMGKTSEYRGVYFADRRKHRINSVKHWTCTITRQRFATELEAAFAYNIAAKEKWGDNALLNNVEKPVGWVTLPVKRKTRTFGNISQTASGKFKAQVSISGKIKCLGTFLNIKQAEEAIENVKPKIDKNIIRNEEGIAVLKTSCGRNVLVDDDVWLACISLKIRISINGYPTISSSSLQTSLHRFVMKAEKGMIIDHINRDIFDARLKNLRVCTFSQNSQNKEKKVGAIFKGVRKGLTSFSAEIMVNRKHYGLGSYETPDEAAWVYNMYAIHFQGSDAYTNDVITPAVIKRIYYFGKIRKHIVFDANKLQNPIFREEYLKTVGKSIDVKSHNIWK